MKSDSNDPSELVTIGRFPNPAMAAIVQGRLQSMGIPCFRQHENTGFIPEISGNFLNGIMLQVPAGHLAEAERILAELDAVPQDDWGEV